MSFSVTCLVLTIPSCSARLYVMILNLFLFPFTNFTKWLGITKNFGSALPSLTGLDLLKQANIYKDKLQKVQRQRFPTPSVETEMNLRGVACFKGSQD